MKKIGVILIASLLVNTVPLQAQNINLSERNLQPIGTFMSLQKIDAEQTTRGTP